VANKIASFCLFLKNLDETELYSEAIRQYCSIKNIENGEEK
jgi:hypothetical protein